MAFDPPVAFNNGDPLTLALANQYMVDNVQFLHDNLGILDSSKVAFSELSVDGVFDFQNLPQDYDDLTIVALLRGSAAAINSALYMRFNGDAGASAYTNIMGRVHNTSPTGVSVSANTTDSELLFSVFGNTATAGYYSALVMHIVGYSQTVAAKTVSGHALATVSDLPAAMFFAGMWFNAAAIDRIQITNIGNNFVAGSRVSIYAGQHLT